MLIEREFSTLTTPQEEKHKKLNSDYDMMSMGVKDQHDEQGRSIPDLSPIKESLLHYLKVKLYIIF